MSMKQPYILPYIEAILLDPAIPKWYFSNIPALNYVLYYSILYYNTVFMQE